MRTAYEMPRVLVVDDDMTSRLTLQTLLMAGGYSVDSAASGAEAVGKMDEREYELVLSDVGMESPDAGYRVLAHARTMFYKPATAFITTHRTGSAGEPQSRFTLVEPEDVPELLTRVADLIGRRASRRIVRQAKSQ